MDIYTKSYQTKNGLVEGVQVRWSNFSILLVTGKKAFLTCGVFDLDAIDAFGGAAAIVESTPGNPIGNLDRFPNRKITKVNSKAKTLGIAIGMDVKDAFDLIA
ncbi:MAG TPA: DUF1805 domain-containing protein [Candidatus Omnitrophota bacterium]|nr:DUF1805 domain-containing protein [Candidatus Omnitrophota bacterium]HPT07696.1 DUF1805 domain-containing protein [Candidatus Omnitrophota bacterium]